jgi:hypothetical protein
LYQAQVYCGSSDQSAVGLFVTFPRSSRCMVADEQRKITVVRTIVIVRTLLKTKLFACYLTLAEQCQVTTFGNFQYIELLKAALSPPGLWRQLPHDETYD